MTNRQQITLEGIILSDQKNLLCDIAIAQQKISLLQRLFHRLTFHLRDNSLPLTNYTEYNSPPLTNY